jgi:hypothetical protein
MGILVELIAFSWNHKLRIQTTHCTSAFTLTLVVFLVISHAYAALPECNYSQPITIRITSPKDTFIDTSFLEIVAVGNASELDHVDIYFGENHAKTIEQFEYKDFANKYDTEITVPLSMGENAVAGSIKVPEGGVDISVYGWDKKKNCGTHRRRVLAQKGQMRAIIIGIKEYEHVRPLKYADTDAEKIRDYLVNNILIPPANITLIQNKGATLREIRKAFDAVKNLGKIDTLIVFFSGHGFLSTGLPNSPPTYYLAPTDFETLSQSTLYQYSLFENDLSEINAERKILFIDACFSGQQGAKTLSPTGMKLGGDSPWKSSKVKGLFGIFSSDGNQSSWENDEFKQGVFTHFLLEAGNQAIDQDQDGIISLREAYDYLKREVPQYTTTHHKESQEPQLKNDGEAYALPWGKRR